MEAEVPDKGTVYAEEGTLAHALCEAKLRERNDTALSYLRNSELYAEEMEDYTDGYVDYVHAVLKAERERTPDARLLVEVRLDLSAYAPECFGTADAVVVGDGRLNVIDFKYGKGVAVDARENPQLMLYGLGALEALDYMFAPYEVRMHIFQPRLGNVSQFLMTAESLRLWGRDVLKPRAAEAYAGGGRQEAGDWCRFCKVRQRCRTLAAYCTPPETDKDPRLLTAAELPELLKRVPLMKTWAADLEAYALQLALDGTEVPGYKVVEGRSRRVINDEAGLADALTASGWKPEQFCQPRTLLPLTGLEKLCGKKAFAELAAPFLDKPPGKPTLVPESDRRPAYRPDSAESDFANVNLDDHD